MTFTWYLVMPLISTAPVVMNSNGTPVLSMYDPQARVTATTDFDMLNRPTVNSKLVMKNLAENGIGMTASVYDTVTLLTHYERLHSRKLSEVFPFTNLFVGKNILLIILGSLVLLSSVLLGFSVGVRYGITFSAEVSPKRP